MDEPLGRLPALPVAGENLQLLPSCLLITSACKSCHCVKALVRICEVSASCIEMPSTVHQRLQVMKGDSTKLAKGAAAAKENGNNAACAVTAWSTCAHGPLYNDACVQMTCAKRSNC